MIRPSSQDLRLSRAVQPFNTVAGQGPRVIEARLSHGSDGEPDSAADVSGRSSRTQAA